MGIDSSAGYASAISLLQTRGSVQLEQVRQTAAQLEQSTQALQTGTVPAASGGRGQVVDLLV